MSSLTVTDINITHQKDQKKKNTTFSKTDEILQHWSNKQIPLTLIVPKPSVRDKTGRKRVSKVKSIKHLVIRDNTDNMAKHKTHKYSEQTGHSTINGRL